MLRFINNKKGFSLIELMVTLALLSIMIIGLVTFFGGGIRSWITGNNQLRSQREARMAMDRMVKEMRSGESVTFNSEQSVTVNIPAFGSDNPSYRVTFKKDDDSLKKETVKNGVTSSSELLSEISKLEFSVNGNRIDIELEMDLDDDGKSDINLKTDVFLRNS
jgi:prepilin-type N-terminal cleavage/methylation domain-containing protein